MFWMMRRIDSLISMHAIRDLRHLYETWDAKNRWHRQLTFRSIILHVHKMNLLELNEEEIRTVTVHIIHSARCLNKF